jgi:hypothetical protein
MVEKEKRQLKLMNCLLNWWDTYPLPEIEEKYHEF